MTTLLVHTCAQESSVDQYMQQILESHKMLAGQVVIGSIQIANGS